MLTFCLQSELARSADAPVPAVRRDVASNSGVQNDVSNTAVVVSDGYRNTLKSPDNTRGKNRMVSTVRTLPVAG